MIIYAADDHEAIRRRLEELAAERNLALTGSTIQVPLEEDKTYGMYGPLGYDYDPA